MGTTPVGLTRDLPPKRVMRTEVDTQDIVVWRSASGALAAWRNRCPHRGMRLSHGFVRGENLACLYHGWHYGPDTVCRYIPAHPDLEPPETIRATAFSALEQDGVIWVSVDGTPAPPPLPADMMPLRSMAFACTSENVIAALESTPFEGTAPQRIRREGPCLVLAFPNEEGANRLVAMMQSLETGQTRVHFILSAGQHNDRLCMFSGWCEAARRRAEAGASVIEATP